MSGGKETRIQAAAKIAARVYPTFAGPTEEEIQALEDLTLMSRMNYTCIGTRRQNE